MRNIINVILACLIIIGLVVLVVFWWRRSQRSNAGIITTYSNPAYEVTPTPLPSTVPTVSATPTPTVKPTFKLPIANFYSRITKKTFGLYVTPQNSPVQPERFAGYHTGVDIEYGDVSGDVQVYAIADGTVVRSGWVSGYGGTIAISHNINGKKIVVIYGHLRPASLVANNKSVKAGQQIAVLGTGYSNETDGERKHLHFAVRADNTANVAGYVKIQSELSGWQDPVTFMHSLGL